ncbi:hemolymph lipopolysaccharide-binding protein-like isoform X2 [Diprion similis]|uniref:hemolymph lipopolysaccharide-binding protein-like isoform X2 n=1 Tax=Diprion similis TaxID=362088 RepID=UPI001EF99D99|nr:hemolymph lipopolysaccharide-binding protein-like isoform X2 [Diprion similis]
MASALTLIVLGTVNFYGAVPNNQSSVVPGLNLTSTTNIEELISLYARRKNYIYTPGIGAHKLHTATSSWNMARHNCQDEGGHLAVINSADEAQIIGHLVDTANLDMIWIGAHDLFNTGEFVTVQGESIFKAGYNSWERGEPNNAENVEHCVTIKRSGRLNDRNCRDTLSYICELNYLQIYGQK